MSDAPKTDKMWHDILSAPDDYAEWAKVRKLRQLSTELEIENAALRIIQSQDKENYQCAMKACVAVEEQLKAENADLRKRIEILSAQNAKQTEDYICVDREHGLWKRKEAQP